MTVTHFEGECRSGDQRVTIDTRGHSPGSVFFHLAGAGFSVCSMWNAALAREVAQGLMAAADRAEADKAAE